MRSSAFVQFGGFFGGECIAEAVAELLGGQCDRALLVGWVPRRNRGDPQRRRWQVHDAFDRCSVDRHRCSGEVLPQQPLDDEASERMADHDWLGIERADDLAVVLDDVVDAVTGAVGA